MQDKSYKRMSKVYHSTEIKKDGFKRYKCKICKHVFQNKTYKKYTTQKKIQEKYCFKRQIYKNISEEYGLSVRTIKNIIDTYEFITP